MTHDLPFPPMMFAAIARGTVSEVIAARRQYDFAIGDFVCFREFCELSNRYTNAAPVVVRILGVLGHSHDSEHVPYDHGLISFEPVKPAASVPVAPKIGTHGLSIKTFGAPHRVRSASRAAPARARKAKPRH